MSRRRRAKKRIVSPDPTYDSFIHMLVNRVMSHGKKSLLIKLFIKLWNLLLKNTTRSNWSFRTSYKNAKPLVEVKARRIGGAAIQVPLELTLNAELY
jgi:small subunit ribosomal protein S7